MEALGHQAGEAFAQENLVGWIAVCMEEGDRDTGDALGHKPLRNTLDIVFLQGRSTDPSWRTRSSTRHDVLAWRRAALALGGKAPDILVPAATQNRNILKSGCGDESDALTAAGQEGVQAGGCPVNQKFDVAR